MNTNYSRPPAIDLPGRTWPNATISTPPAFCAVDLRDGNQALPNPMTPDQKKRYFKLLCDIGFKEIEVGFPSASQDDFQFCRDLIEDGMIPDDVVISVLTQAREHLIARTMEALAGVKQAVVHFYIATSELHSQFVFGLNPDQVLEAAVAACRQIREAVDANFAAGTIGLEFSPEEFTDTDPEFALAICDAVVKEWRPAPAEKVILNLPATVERRLPNEYADLIEDFLDRCAYPDNSLVSLHVHNDMGCGVASTMLSLLAGATRVEGTLFGHGERTGNVDLVTVALNIEYLGVDTGLDFSNLMEISEIVAEVTDMGPHPRHPYAGELVFTAFSGSHQDAIHKGLSRRDKLADHFGGWKIPYLHVDPSTLGRSFKRFIRINSQSGKGGIAHVIETEYQVRLPRWFQVDLAAKVQAFADEAHREVSGDEVWDIFQKHYVTADEPLALINYWPRPGDGDPTIIDGEVHVRYRGETTKVFASGNGPISAFVNALRELPDMPAFTLGEYEEETMGHSADARAVAFIRVTGEGDSFAIGAGIDSNIDQAAVRALVVAVNGLLG
jgi:2-isopropylmalate synthase